MSYEIFKRLCEKNGVKPSDITKETGITSATFTSWKQGKYTPKAEKLQQIADYFGVSLEYLMTGGNKSHYMDSETATLAQEAFDSPEMRLLFDAAKGSSAEDILLARQVLLACKRKSGND